MELMGKKRRRRRERPYETTSKEKHHPEKQQGGKEMASGGEKERNILWLGVLLHDIVHCDCLKRSVNNNLGPVPLEQVSIVTTYRNKGEGAKAVGSNIG